MWLLWAENIGKCSKLVSARQHCHEYKSLFTVLYWLCGLLLGYVLFVFSVLKLLAGSQGRLLSCEKNSHQQSERFPLVDKNKAWLVLSMIIGW